MKFSTACEWVNWINAIHPKKIDLTLCRVEQLVKRLAITPSCPIITVAGTNGKGSTVAALQSIYLAAGYLVGAYTSPFLHHPKEMVCVNGKEVTDESWCEAFQQIEDSRQGILLTPFEYQTLAAFLILINHPLHIWLLEVGLGGRLDAVNALPADVAIITSIDIDHREWLGNTRDEIGYEKAGIMRTNHPAIYGDPNPPLSVIHHAKKMNAPFFIQHQHYGFRKLAKGWEWNFENKIYKNLPDTSLALQNMSTALMAITLLQPTLPVAENAIQQGLNTVNLPARLQTRAGAITEIFDVAHNPAAVKWLADHLLAHQNKGKTLAVFSMLADKDITKSITIIAPCIDEWYVAPLQSERSFNQAALNRIFSSFQLVSYFFSSIFVAYREAKLAAKPGDRIVIFGSFHTVAETRGLR